MELLKAHAQDLDIVCDFVDQYHKFEHIESTTEQRKSAIKPLLTKGSNLGEIYLISVDNEFVGYIAVCFCYSIEHGGKEAFIDEFYVRSNMRGRGIGQAVINSIKQKLEISGCFAIHLDVAKDNEIASKLYRNSGFKERQKYIQLSFEY